MDTSAVQCRIVCPPTHCIHGQNGHKNQLQDTTPQQNTTHTDSSPPAAHQQPPAETQHPTCYPHSMTISPMRPKPIAPPPSQPHQQPDDSDIRALLHSLHPQPGIYLAADIY